MGLMLGLATPVFKVAPEFCLTPKIKSVHGLKGETHIKSSFGLHLIGKLICTEIIKIVATGCQILRLKCSKFDFSSGSTSDPAGEA